MASAMFLDVHNVRSNVPNFLLDLQRCAGDLGLLTDEALPQRLQFSLVLNQGPLVVEEVLPHFVDVDRLLEARLGVVDAVFNHFLEVDVVLVQRFRVQLQVQVQHFSVLIRQGQGLVVLEVQERMAGVLDFVEAVVDG